MNWIGYDPHGMPLTGSSKARARTYEATLVVMASSSAKTPA